MARQTWIQLYNSVWFPSRSVLFLPQIFWTKIPVHAITSVLFANELNSCLMIYFQIWNDDIQMKKSVSTKGFFVCVLIFVWSRSKISHICHQNHQRQRFTLYLWLYSFCVKLPTVCNFAHYIHTVGNFKKKIKYIWSFGLRWWFMLFCCDAIFFANLHTFWCKIFRPQIVLV